MRTAMSFGEKAKQVQASRIDPTQITLAQGHATAIEEFENLDRDFAPARRLIAELCGGEPGMSGPGGQIGGNPDHLAHSRAQEEMVVRGLVRPPIRPARFRIRRTSTSGRPVVAAMSRTRGGRNRSVPPSSGATVSQAPMSSAVSLTSCEGSLTKAPSKASSFTRASFCKAASNAGFGSRGRSVMRSSSRPIP